MSETRPPRITESAARDLEEIQAWYQEQDVAAVGKRLVAEVVSPFAQLRDFPESGPVVPEFNNPSLRQLIQPPFRIVYRFDGKEVMIVRVWHSERLMVVEGLDVDENAK